MRYRSLAIAAALALGAGSALAQTGPAVTTGGMTREACSVLTVTATAYTSGNVVGGLITLTPAWRAAAQGAPDQGGLLQSLRLTSQSTQTASFSAWEFTAIPAASTWTDKAAPNILLGDKLLVRPPLTLTATSSGLGNHTVYGLDNIGRAHVAATQSEYWILTVTGTPTFGTASDLQFCATYRLD